MDPARDRRIPVAIHAGPDRSERSLKLAILSHGYGARNTDYTFIAEYLAARGYFVASIQHEIPGDEPLPASGNLYVTRMPSWESGVRNILFVIDELSKTRPGLDVRRPLLIGHSHGGDISMLFARRYPSRLSAVITLDNRRMPFPRTKQPRVLSIRSSDQPADDGVIPSPEEQARLGMTVVTLPATLHNEMWDGGTETQKAEMLRHIDEFLRREE